MTQTAYDPDSFLSGGGVAAAKFETTGTAVTGTITEPPEVRQQTKLGSGEPLTWDNGDPRLQLVVTVLTEQRDDEDDDGKRRFYVKGSKDPKSKSMHAAVAGAVHAAGARGLEVGGTLTIRYVGDGTASKVGFNAPKQYEAVYVRPDASAASGDFLGTGAAATTATTPAQDAPAAGTGKYTADQEAALRAAGIDPATLTG